MPLDQYALATVATFRSITGIAVADLADATVEDLLNAASDVIEGYCQRNFIGRAYREFLDGTGEPYLLLKQRPVSAITRVCTGQYAALQVTFTLANSSNASVTVDEAGTTMTLRSVTSAVVTSNALDLTAAANDTIGELATVITALAGWTATATAGYAEYPSIDLWQIVGAYCMDTPLMLAIAGLPESEFDLAPSRGELRLLGAWRSGYRNVLVEYTAGYGTAAGDAPEDVQAVCVELARGIGDFAQANGLLTGERLGPYSWTAGVGLIEGGPFTDGMKERLLPYRETLLI